MENENILRYSVKVGLFPSYFDLNDKIKPTSIMSLFQDIASVHGEQMGVGFLPMIEKKLYWVITRVKYDIEKAPVPYQEVVVETWPHEKGKVDFDRDYLIKDLNGNVLIKGTSKWCVISTETRKLELPTAVEYPEGMAYCTDENYTERFVKTPSIERKEVADYVHEVAYHEIDHNLHLNNVNYATYVFNTVKSSEISHMQINFISECKLGDKIEVFKKFQDDGSVLISGYVADDLKFSALTK